MKLPNKAHFKFRSLSLATCVLWAGLAACTGLHAQEADATSKQTSPALSETTLQILEAQAQANLESPSIKTPDESRLTGNEPRKMETGGLLKEWFAPLERKKNSENDQADGETSRKSKRKPFWKWFDPTAPLTKEELNAKPIDWKGQRIAPQSFGSPQKTDPEGLKLFFIRYK